MPKHCAALPGAANELFGSSTAELATALIQRLGAAFPAPRANGSRHAAVLHMPSPYAPRPATTSRSALRTLAQGRLAQVNLAQVRARVPSRPVLAALSVTAVGAAAAITATGQFAAVAPAAAPAALSLTGTSSVTHPPAGAAVAPAAPAAGVAAPVAAAAAPAPALLDLPTVQISKVVRDATTTAKDLAAKDLAAKNLAAKDLAAKQAGAKALSERTAAAKRAAAAAAAVAAAAHVPAPSPPDHSAQASTGTGVGAEALSSAMTKLGKPYSWGAVGPNAFDCSGLVVWAFRQAGVSMPRTSAAQSTAGTAVSRSQLQPGDLVFFYSPVSHVGIYVGNGKVINATQSGDPVQISDMAYMPFHNARRL